MIPRRYTKSARAPLLGEPQLLRHGVRVVIGEVYEYLLGVAAFHVAHHVNRKKHDILVEIAELLPLLHEDVASLSSIDSSCRVRERNSPTLGPFLHEAEHLLHDALLRGGK